MEQEAELAKNKSDGGEAKRKPGRFPYKRMQKLSTEINRQQQDFEWKKNVKQTLNIIFRADDIRCFGVGALLQS